MSTDTKADGEARAKAHALLYPSKLHAVKCGDGGYDGAKHEPICDRLTASELAHASALEAAERERDEARAELAEEEKEYGHAMRVLDKTMTERDALRGQLAEATRLLSEIQSEYREAWAKDAPDEPMGDPTMGRVAAFLASAPLHATGEGRAKKCYWHSPQFTHDGLGACYDCNRLNAAPASTPAAPGVREVVERACPHYCKRCTPSRHRCATTDEWDSVCGGCGKPFDATPTTGTGEPR